MKSGFKNGWSMIKECLRLFGRYPGFLVPLLFCWAVYAPAIIYLEFLFPWEQFSLWGKLGVVFLVIMAFSTTIGIANLAIIELVHKLENGQQPSVLLAIWRTLTRNFFVALPVIIGWAVIWFITTVIEMIVNVFTRRGSDEDEDDGGPDELNMENATRVVAGFDDISLSRAIFEMIRKSVRMIVFLILPAIAWERRSSGSAFKRGLDIAKAHKVELGTGFILTEVAGAVLFLAPALLFYISGKFDVEFPDWVWLTTFLYVGFAWSFYLLLEQLFAAELFMWHLKWEKACQVAESAGAEKPGFSSITPPSVFDDINDLDGIETDRISKEKEY